MVSTCWRQGLIYGNTKEGSMYPAYYADGAGKKLNGANKYTIRFEPGKWVPPPLSQVN